MANLFCPVDLSDVVSSLLSRSPFLHATRQWLGWIFGSEQVLLELEH